MASLLGKYVRQQVKAAVDASGMAGKVHICSPFEKPQTGWSVGWDYRLTSPQRSLGADSPVADYTLGLVVTAPLLDADLFVEMCVDYSNADSIIRNFQNLGFVMGDWEFGTAEVDGLGLVLMAYSEAQMSGYGEFSE